MVASCLFCVATASGVMPCTLGWLTFGPDLRFKTTQGTSEHEGDAEPRVSQWNEPGQGCKY